MALEAWLLNQAKQGHDIAEVFQTILDSSTSTSTIAVLASVATAYPQAVGDKVLSILRVREFYRWDFERSLAERFHPTDLRSALGVPSGGIEDVYYNERKQSAELPHRASNLEKLAFRLQFTPFGDRVRAVIDDFRASLPLAEEQREEDKTWRIALHRMDARQFDVQPGEEQGQVVLTPSEPPADLQRFIDKSTETLAPQNRRLRLAWWGLARFRGEPDPHDAFPDWHDAFSEAQALWGERQGGSETTALGLSGPVFVAAHLIRDHYPELNAAEVAWCQTVVIEEVLRKDLDTGFHDRHSRNSFDGSRPAAAVLPLLVQHSKGDEARFQIEQCLAVAVTHASQEVRDYAADGVQTWLWGIDPALAKACVAGLIALAGAENDIRRAHRRAEDYSREAVEHKIVAATSNIRSQILSRQILTLLVPPQVDLRTHDWPELLDALSMVPPDTADPDLNALVAATLGAALRDAEAGEAWKSRGGATYEFQYPFAKLFARFALARSVDEAIILAEPLRESIEKCPKCLGVLLEHLVHEEDRARSGSVFWAVWRSIARAVFDHRLLREGSNHVWRYDGLRKLASIFTQLKELTL